MIDLCTSEEDAAFGEICRDNYRLKRKINMTLAGKITEVKKPMKRQRPSPVQQAERRAIDKLIWGK